MVFRLKNSFGVGTPRYIGALPHKFDPTLLDISCGSSIARWNVKEEKRYWIRTDHTDLVMGMVHLPNNNIITVSYDGEVFLQDKDYNVLSKYFVKEGHLAHLALNVNGTRVITFSQSNKGEINLLTLNGHMFTKDLQIDGQYYFPDFNQKGDIIAIAEDLYNDKVPGAELVIFSGKDGTIILKRKLDGKVETALPNKDCMVLAYHQGRKIEVVSMSTLESVYTFVAPGTGLVIDILYYDDDSILVPSSDGKATLWEKGLEVKLILLPSGNVRYMDWAKGREILWVVTEDAIHNVNINNPTENYELHYHQLACCGIDIHPNGQWVAAGDLLSQVIVWDILSGSIVKQTMVGLPVRCLTWSPDGESLQIGCLDGNVFHWDIANNKEPQVYFSLLEGVTSIKWENGQNPNCIAAGTIDGTLAILQKNPGESNLKIKLAIKAHKPSTEKFDSNFGSLTKFAEIWSITWSPDNLRIATASEDQKICIWNMNGEKLASLSGHSTAVTSVDWKITNIGPLLASCADDRTIRIWLEKDNTWELYHIFETKHLTEWHTVTYLALQEGGSHLVCTTQNGYLFVFHLEKKVELFGKRMHQGSVEGVVWNTTHGLIASCSSDCTVNVYTLQ